MTNNNKNKTPKNQENEEYVCYITSQKYLTDHDHLLLHFYDNREMGKCLGIEKATAEFKKKIQKMKADVCDVVELHARANAENIRAEFEKKIRKEIEKYQKFLKGVECKCGAKVPHYNAISFMKEDLLSKPKKKGDLKE